MTYQVVIPSIFQSYTNRCLASCLFPTGSLLVVDNTVQNRGVAASWNLGIRIMKIRNADWLVICSAAMRFGDPGGLDFIAELDNHDFIVEAAHGMGWHLIAFHRSVIERVGLFDVNFHPAYYEDSDYGRRINLAFPDYAARWKKVSVDVSLAGFVHGCELGGVEVDNIKLQDYYRRKWGGDHQHETFTHPFNDPGNDISWWPQREPS